MWIFDERMILKLKYNTIIAVLIGWQKGTSVQKVKNMIFLCNMTKQILRAYEHPRTDVYILSILKGKGTVSLIQG